MAVAPLFGGHAEQGHVQDIRLGGVNQVYLAWSQFRRDQVLFDGVGVNPVVDLGKIAPDVPAELFAFLFLEPLELLDQVELELDGYPGRELEGDVLMGEGTAVAAGFGNDADGVRFFDPLLGGSGVKLLSPAWFLNPSNSMGLKSGLFNCSQMPRNSMVLRFRSQFWMM